jgi:hypothetical protein
MTKMKPRTVMLTLELRNCVTPLSALRRLRCLSFQGLGGLVFDLNISQVTATVQQPSEED